MLRRKALVTQLDAPGASAKRAEELEATVGGERTGEPER
jgi:hypothetical protein